MYYIQLKPKRTMEKVHSLKEIFNVNESLIEIFEEALEKSLENLNLSNTGNEQDQRPK